MQDQALKIASHVPHPLWVAAFALVIAAVVFVLLVRSKQLFLALVAGVGIIILGLSPLVASTVVRSRGVYRVNVVVLRPDQSLADIAQVKSSNSGVLKMVSGGWELDIPPQARPADGNVTLFASVKDEFLNGKSTLVLAQDYYPTATIQLLAETSAKLRGVVVYESLVAVAGATVSIEGYPDTAVTDKMGNFVLPAHAGNGQMVEVRARKGQLVGHLSAPAGKVAEVIISRE
jgi:hypothetical protein